MDLKTMWQQSELRKWLHNCIIYNDYRRIRRLHKRHGWTGMRFLLHGHLWLDYVEVVVTTKCNLCCPGCANLMQYYKNPYHVDRETLLTSVRKLCESFDACDHLKILGGEPFLYPDLKDVLEAIPREKLGKITIATNGTVVPDDPELIEAIRQKNATVYFSNYPSARDGQKRFVDLLERGASDMRFLIRRHG